MSEDDKMALGSPTTCTIAADETLLGGNLRAGQTAGDRVDHSDKLSSQQPATIPAPSVASAPAPIPSCTTALSDGNFMLLYDKSAPPATAAFAPALTVYTPTPAVVVAPAPSRTVAAAPAHPLDNTNFLLLAEFAHVVRDTLALRGIQVDIYILSTFSLNFRSLPFNP